MKYVFFFCIIAHFCSAQSVAERLIEKSIKYHDPKNNWSDFKASIDINSIVIRNSKSDTSERRLVLSLADEYFRMVQDTTVYELPCEDCERTKMYYNYFQYLLGMPMKLRDAGTIVDENIDLKTYKNKQYKVVNVTYDPKVGSDSWKFYIDPKTYELAIIEFSKDGTFQSGETIELNNKTKFQGMLLPGQLRWLVLPDRVFLAEENIKYRSFKNK